MTSGFSYPPPPPPPSRQGANATQQSRPTPPHHARGGRGGRGGQHYPTRGRGAHAGRDDLGARSSNNSVYQQSGFEQQAAYGQQLPNNMNDWAAQSAQQFMAMYGMGNPPPYAQSLPSYAPNPYPQIGQQPMQNSVWQREQPGPQADAQGADLQGLKRKREVNPAVPAPPAVPSFGAPLPARPPFSTVVASTPTQGRPNIISKNQRKKQKKNNQLGLTPQGEDHEESGDDADEEGQYASANQSGPITVTYGHKTIKLATPADFKAWVEERKKNWPTQVRVQQKKEERAKLATERSLMEKQFREASKKEHEENKRKKNGEKGKQQLQGEAFKSHAQNTLEQQQDKGSQKPPQQREGIKSHTQRSMEQQREPPKDKAQSKVEAAHILKGEALAEQRGASSSAPLAPHQVNKSHAKQANDKPSQSVRPSKQPPSKLEKLQAKAAKYRRLADEAEIAALEAKAKALGYSLVKIEEQTGNVSENATPARVSTPSSDESLTSHEEVARSPVEANALSTAASKQDEPELRSANPSAGGVSVGFSAASGKGKEKVANFMADVCVGDRLSGSQGPPFPGIPSQVDSLIEEASVIPPTETTKPEDENTLFTLDTAGDRSLMLDDVDGSVANSLRVMHAPKAPHKSHSLSSSDSDSRSSSSSSSDLSDDDSDEEWSQSGKVKISEKARSPPIPNDVSHAQNHEQKVKPCFYMSKNGTCKYGDGCRYSHDSSLLKQHWQQPQQEKQGKQQKQEKQQNVSQKSGSRKSLHSRLLDQQDEERRTLVLSAIKFLGEQGVLDDDVVEKASVCSQESVHE